MLGLKFLQAMLKPGLVGNPLASHEDEAVERHALAKNRHIFERLLENNEETAVHRVAVRQPPQIDPVCVDLMIRYQHQSFRKLQLQSSILHQLNLTSHTLISTDANVGWAPPFGKSSDNQSEVLLGECHVGVIIVLVDEIQWGSNNLGHNDDYAAAVEPPCHNK